MTKKEPLVKGQRVIVEKTGGFTFDPDRVNIEGFQVSRVNASTAYLADPTDCQLKRRPREIFKVDQKTHKLKENVITGNTFRLWLTADEYEEARQKRDERDLLLQKARKLVEEMDLDALKQFVATETPVEEDRKQKKTENVEKNKTDGGLYSMSSNMELNIMWTLSTSHLSPDTVARFNNGDTPSGLVVYEKSEYGFFLYFTDDAEESHLKFNEDLKKIYLKASLNNIFLLCFDRDAEVVSGLKTFDW